MTKKEAEAAGNWTPRSQASILRQEELERQRADLQGRIARLKGKIADLEKQREIYAEQTVARTAGIHVWESLNRTLADLRAANDELDLWQEKLEEVEKKIVACEPTPEEAAQRQKGQEALARSAEERLALDEKIDAQLAQLRKLLGERHELTGRMATLAQELELDTDLDLERFDALASALPAQMAQQSRSWVDLLVGREKLPVRAFARERLVLAETLTQTGIYPVGQEMRLTQEQFNELHRMERPSGIAGLGNHFRPPSVLTPEEHEAAEQKAKEHGVSVQEVIEWEDSERFLQEEEEGRAKHGANRERKSVVLKPSRRVRVLSAIGMDGKDYKSGEVIECGLHNAKQIQDLVRSGVVEPV